MSQNITSLQSSTSALAASIEAMKSSQGKAIHVLDANNQDLGLLIDSNTSETDVFNTTLNLLIPIETSGGYIGLHDPYAYYTTSNCTGTPYYPASGTMSNLYTITQVNNPYQNPVTLPLQYKYQ